MTEKDLHRLRRQEILQLLLEQVKEAEQLQTSLSGIREQLQEAEALSERLKTRLNEKDEQIEHLKARLDQKDERIKNLKRQLEQRQSDQKIRLEQAGSIADASLRLSGVFEAAQKAADLYLENIRLLCEEPPKQEDADE